MKNKSLIVTAICLTYFFPSPAYAVELPDFSNCPNPGGTLIASYDSGVHGIVGRSETFVGADHVYSVSSSQVVQCYCAADASGIQTNWIKSDVFSPSEKDELLRLGWIRVPNGALWGLSQGEWLAQNSDFTCGDRGGSTPSNSSSSSSSVSSSISSIVPQILGFADTGRQLVSKMFSSAGGAFMVGGVLLILLSLKLKRSK